MDALLEAVPTAPVLGDDENGGGGGRLHDDSKIGVGGAGVKITFIG